METIQSLRNEIDTIDLNIIGLLDKRMSLAYKIGIFKGLDNIEVFASDREKEIHTNLNNVKTEHIQANELMNIFIQIIKVGRDHGYIGHHKSKQEDEE